MLIDSVDDLQPGDIGFSVIGGHLGGLISLGQALLRPACWFTHTWVVAGSGGRIVEAMPGGARYEILRGRDRIGPGYGWVRLPLTTAQRINAGRYAMEAVGTPYSFLDYLALATHGRVLRRRVTDSGHMICSQLVDQVLTQAGYHLFDDGRLPQDVTPGALFRQAGAQGQVCWE